MDFPVFHLDFFGNRMLIAVIAIIHVMINHALAVGAIPLIALMEWWGWRRGSAAWDRLAYRVLFTAFVITTSWGALTGVGIWFSTSLVNPDAIGSLIRVFFAAWFTEWVVFFLEVAVILTYFLTWKRMAHKKGAHVAIGVALALFSWATMAIIVAILGFMMDPGNWMANRSFLSGVFNPIYLPQLAFRTPLAMLSAGLFVLFLIYFFTRDDRPLRVEAIRVVSIWSLAWLPAVLAGGLWYRAVIPGWMADNMPVAIATQIYQGWYRSLLGALVAIVVVVGLAALAGAVFPARVPRVALLVPFTLVLVLLATFERVREFVRKPYVIGSYMFANGMRVDEMPLLQEDGLLAHATYAEVRTITPATRLEAGREVFRLACTRCHTTSGVNSVLGKLQQLYGAGALDRDTVKAYLKTMHNARPYMPEFPGSDEEAGALADWLIEERAYPRALAGAQTAGVRTAPPLPPPGDAAAAPAEGGGPPGGLVSAGAGGGAR